MRRTICIALAPLALASCQTWGPAWSEVTGRRFHLTELNRNVVIIERVDERSAFPNQPGEPIKVEPGQRMLRLQGVPFEKGWQGTLKDMRLDVQPCRRYYINAQFDNRLSPSDWAPVVDYVEPIAGCRA